MNSNQCSFCGRKRNEVQMLISGQNGFICENCIEQAHAIVKDSVQNQDIPGRKYKELKNQKRLKNFLISM
jgi:ATP-dependent Clp protease ATP-binding subunit ClpX